MNPEIILKESEKLFEYVEAEKDRFYKQARKIRIGGMTTAAIFVVLYFFPRLIDKSILVAFIVTIVMLACAMLPFWVISNDTILPSKTTRLFYQTYKINLVRNIIKLISQDLNYRPQNRILNKPIIQSGLFGDKITEFKGRNLIIGQFGKFDIQMSEIQLWKGLPRLFKGFFVFASNLDEPNIDIQAIKALNGRWAYKDNNLYLAFPKEVNFFEVKIEKSNQSIENVKDQTRFLLAVIGIIEKATKVTSSSDYVIEKLPSVSEETLSQHKTFSTLVTNEVHVLASNSRRFINLIIDISAISLFCFPILTMVYSNINQIATKKTIALTGLIVSIIIAFLYYLILELIFQATIGKALTKTTVISITGNHPRFKNLLIRSISRFIPFEAYSYINSEVGLHDKLSKTRVIRTDIKLNNC